MDAQFRRGFSRLAALQLSFDAWIFPGQLDELISLGRAFPETTIVLNHVSAPRGTGSYQGRHAEVLAHIVSQIPAIAACPNVFVKLGGLGTPLTGFGFGRRETRPASHELSAAWAPFLLPWIDGLGPDRCMFESNFPPDRASCSYRTLWNAFKRIAHGYSDAERRALFGDTARSVYWI